MNSWVRAVATTVLVSSAFSISSLGFAADSTGSTANPPEAAPPVATGPADVARGRAISYTCLGCHGIAGYRNAYPNYRVPKLVGQHPEYIVSALKEYRQGERSHPTMHAQSETLSDQDIVDIAAYFAAAPVVSKGGSSAQVPAAAGVCVACHGPDGVGTSPVLPTLSGQHQDYLARALHEYKYGGRKNLVMGTFATQLSDEQIEQLATYYSRGEPSLNTLERPNTRFGMKAER